MTGARGTFAPTPLILGGLLACQIYTGIWLLDLHERREVIAPAPSHAAGLAVALGDGEFFFRSSALKLMNIGVTGGDTVPLRDMDYDRLEAWFHLMDGFDSRSVLIPVLAGYWYGFTPELEDARHIVDYLMARAEIDPRNAWRWRLQAIYLAKHRIQDLPYALEIAETTAAIDDPYAPFFLKQMPAFVLEDLGEEEAALILLQSILETDPNIPENEALFLQHAIERLSSTQQDEP